METLDDLDLRLPRILCLHGGGTNAQIFRAQCRVLSTHLKGKFRLCFAQAPLPSRAGPDVISVYRDWGPFRCWIPCALNFPGVNAQTAVSLIENALKREMEADNQKGAMGEWVGLLGFSQGAKICASLLLLQQIKGKYNLKVNFRFAVLLAGRAPLVALDPSLPLMGDMVVEVNGEEKEWPRYPNPGRALQLRIPTIHVHGLRDPGLHLHRQLLEKCCEAGSTKVVEWDGGHRVPIKTKDIDAIVGQILRISEETGVEFDD
jgi:predicted esterase